MTYYPYAVAGVVFCVGLYGIVTSRNLIHAAICLSVMQSSTYILLLAIGYRTHGTAPILQGLAKNAKTVDPVVQAMTLTDVVVSVVVMALILSLALDAHHRSATVDPDELCVVHG